MSDMPDYVEILLVEDNPYDAELSLRALKQNNITNKIVHVWDGEEALDFIYGRGEYKGKNSPQVPKVILLDLKLPKISGLEVLKTLKSDSQWKHIPVVILSSSKEDSDIAECYKLGVNSYIVKPVDFEKFIDVVKNMGLYWLLLNQAHT